MIFMSQSGLTDASREADWDVWYLEHLRIMATVNGVDSAQRFKTVSAGHSPSLAMYTMRSADVFQDPYYQSIRGLGEFLPLIDRRWYQRNLFAGLDIAPAVGAAEVMLVWDAPTPREVPGIEFVWLEAVAIDRSTPYRGIAVLKATDAAAAATARDGIALYRPATHVFHNAGAAGP